MILQRACPLNDDEPESAPTYGTNTDHVLFEDRSTEKKQ